MKPIEKKVWSELETFARAMQRGARVLLSDGNTVTPGADPTGVHVSASVLRQYPIKEIIEPTVLRDWTTEDAKKHVGYAFQKLTKDSPIFIIRSERLALNPKWDGLEYAAPIPGTDPAKWDWKPCKVEVEVPAEKANADLLEAIRGYAEYLRSMIKSTTHTTPRILHDIEEILDRCGAGKFEVPVEKPKSSDRARIVFDTIRSLYSEVDCRISHGAASRGHLEWVRMRLHSIMQDIPEEQS